MVFQKKDIPSEHLSYFVIDRSTSKWKYLEEDMPHLAYEVVPDGRYHTAIDDWDAAAHFLRSDFVNMVDQRVYHYSYQSVVDDSEVATLCHGYSMCGKYYL